MTAVDGSEAVVLVRVPSELDEGAGVEVEETEEELVVATISHVCDGVYPSSSLEVIVVSEFADESLAGDGA